jgi:soluble lytic murein transglycosylase
MTNAEAPRIRQHSRAFALLSGVCLGLLTLITPANAADDISLSAEPSGLIDVTPVGALPSLAAPTTRLHQPGPADIAALKLAAEHYRGGRIGEGDRAAEALSHPTARRAAEWLAVRSGHPAVRHTRITGFLAANPDWSATQTLHKRAEEAFLMQRAPAGAVLAFFAERRPSSPAGHAALAFALNDSGREVEALAAARAAWRDHHMGRELEARMLQVFGDRLTARDHRNRMEMYLFKENAEAALRNAQRAGADFVRLAQARIAVWRRAGGAQAALDAVPPSLRQDTSFIFARAQHHRRAEDAATSAKMIENLTRDPDILVDGDEWWVERRLIARQLLGKGAAGTAYKVAAAHAAEKPQSRIEAEWTAGWIALRFLNRPVEALTHFTNAAGYAETPISLARTAYWQGRAAEALGDAEQAQAHYLRAAEQPIAYYGQIARARLGLPDLPLRSVEPCDEDMPAIRVIRALEAAGLDDAARPLVSELARTLNDPAALETVARIASAANDARMLVSIGKSGVQRGMPLDLTAYPVNGIPEGPQAASPVERAILHAIARQESMFDPRAQSHAGARGLMQLMPATARETARRYRMPYEPGRLNDPAYNAQLGAAHLADLVREWRGSYVLIFAAYNAGSGNVRGWIEAHGDPRDPAVDAIDWVERIPFTETRNYVQRVMENLQVYRVRLEREHPLMIAQDLRRGVRLARFAGEGLSEAPAPPLSPSPRDYADLR